MRPVTTKKTSMRKYNSTFAVSVMTGESVEGSQHRSTTELNRTEQMVLGSEKILGGVLMTVRLTESEGEKTPMFLRVP